MRLISSEIKKLYIKNKILVLFSSVILISLFMQIGANVYPQFSNDSDQKFYESYMDKLNGKYTEEKGQLINNLLSDYNDVNSDMAELETLYSENKISVQNFMQRNSELSDLSAHGNVIDYLSNCNSYVCEDTENHYFIDYISWGQLFQNYGFDFIILVFVLIISVNSILVEQNSNMMVINSVSVKGRKSLGITKIIVVLGSAAVITVIIGLIHYAVYASKYNIVGWNYPLQSVKSYSGVTKNLTLIQAYIMLVIIKTFGYCSFAAFSMFFTILFKKAVPSMTFSLVLVLAPMYILNSSTEGQLRYLLPLPIGAMMSTGYINGNKKMEISEKIIFREVSYMQLTTVFVILLLISVLMLIFVSKKLSGKRFSLPHLRKPLLAALSVFVAVSMCSCSTGTEFKKASDNYVIFPDMNLIYSKSDDIIINVDEIPIDVPSTIGFISGDTAVLKNEKTIYLLDLKTLNKQELTQIGKNYEFDGFLGMEDLIPELNSISIDLSAESLENLIGGYKNYLYFESQGGISKYNIIDGSYYKIIDGKNVSNFQIKDEYAYYINYGKLAKMNLNSEKEELLTENIAGTFEIADNDVYYTNMFDNGYVYSVQSGKVIFDKNCNSICFNGKSLICVNDEGIYLVDNDGYKMVRENGEYIFITADENSMYFFNPSDDSKLIIYNL